MGWEKFFSDEGTALPLGLALMRMGGRSDRPRNLGVELGTAFEQQAKMQQAKQQQMLQQMQMEKIKAAILKEKNAEQYGEDYLNATNPQDPNLRYLAQSNPGGLAELLAKQKMAEEQQSAEMQRFGFGQPQAGAMPQPTPLAGAMQPPQTPQGPQGMFQGDPKQIAAEIMRIKDPAERQAAMQALNQQFNPQAQQPAAPQEPQAPQGLPPQLAGITPEKALMMSMSKSPSIAAAGKLMLKHYEDAEKRKEGLANKKEMADYIAQLKQDNPQSVSPFFTPVPTPDGIVSYDNRKGTGVPLIVNGKNVVKSADSPDLQGAIAGAKAEQKELGEKRANIGGSFDALASVGRAKQILEEGIYSGAWGPLQKEVIKRTPGMDKAKAARTEEFISEIGNTIVPRLKEFGGNDSNEELRYLKAISGGEITMEPAALKKVIESSEAKIKRGIERVKKGQTPDGGKAAPKFLGFE